MDLNKYLNETAAPETQYSKEEYAAMKKAEREAVWVQVDARMGEVLADASTLQGFLDFMSQCATRCRTSFCSRPERRHHGCPHVPAMEGCRKAYPYGEEGYTAIVGRCTRITAERLRVNRQGVRHYTDARQTGTAAR